MPLEQTSWCHNVLSVVMKGVMLNCTGWLLPEAASGQLCALQKGKLATAGPKPIQIPSTDSALRWQMTGDGCLPLIQRLHRWEGSREGWNGGGVDKMGWRQRGSGKKVGLAAAESAKS